MGILAAHSSAQVLSIHRDPDNHHRWIRHRVLGNRLLAGHDVPVSGQALRNLSAAFTGLSAQEIGFVVAGGEFRYPVAVAHKGEHHADALKRDIGALPDLGGHALADSRPTRNIDKRAIKVPIAT
jgi:hypothetical protein